MFWNCQGTGHLRFHKIVAEYRNEFNYDVLCLFNTRISGSRADGIIGGLGYPIS